jgi:two-component system chemotaxis response regulator CheB
MEPILVIAASSGDLSPVRHLMAALPERCLVSVFIVWHAGRHPSILPEILSIAGSLGASHGEDGEPFEAGHIYVAPPDEHMYLDRGLIRLDKGAKVNFIRPAADPLFISAAEAYGASVVGLVLSGYDSDGADGLAAIKEHGGLALVQRPEDLEQPSRPWAAIMAGNRDVSLTAEEILAHLIGLSKAAA